METVEKIINRVKDGYFAFTDWVSRHPHVVVWVALAYVLVRR